MPSISIKDKDNVKIGFDEGALVRISTDKNNPIIIKPLSKDNLDTEVSSKDDVKVNLTNSKGTSNYNALVNKPSINDHVLIGNQKGKHLDLVDAEDKITEQEIDKIIYGG